MGYELCVASLVARITVTVGTKSFSLVTISVEPEDSEVATELFERSNYSANDRAGTGDRVSGTS